MTLADDVVGFTRVAVPSNDVAVAVMPYEPVDPSQPEAFLAGPFAGDGGENSDRLSVRAADGSATNDFVWSESGWTASPCGTNTAATALPGDIVAFDPLGEEPFDFFLFGRYFPAAGDASPAGIPRIASMTVDDMGRFADVEIATGGKPTDILVGDLDDVWTETVVWRYAERLAGSDFHLVWRDAALAEMSSNRLYMVSDAMRDTDADGIPDAIERCVYGTPPLLADTAGSTPPGARTERGSNTRGATADRSPPSRPSRGQQRIPLTRQGGGHAS
jgi:hypothetical protein